MYLFNNLDVLILFPLIFCTCRYRAKSSVSENYVRLNLKRSRYSRGGVKKTGSYYKRQKWKKRSSVCFRCGQVGHWSKSCRQANSSIDSIVNQPSVPVTMNTANSSEVQNQEVSVYINISLHIFSVCIYRQLIIYLLLEHLMLV